MIYNDFSKIPHGQYSVVYVDAPWNFKTWSNKGRGRCPKYNTMTVEDMIKSFPVQNIADDDCAIFMWGTWPKLESCINLMSEWGFTYKTGVFDWGKVTKKSFNSFREICENKFTPNWDDYFNFLDEIVAMGTGYWSRANSEYCLLGTKGQPKRIDRTPLVSDEDASESRSIRQLLLRPRGIHSEKPDEIRQRIVTMMGDVPRIELFARDTFDGWDVFGNEIGDHCENE